MDLCKNGDGNTVKHPRTGECGTCYQRRWYQEQRSPNRPADVPKLYPLPTIGYHAAHHRVYAAKGKASQYACEECGQPAEQWAYKGSDQEQTGFVSYRGRKGQSAVTLVAWSPNPDDYRPLCLTCHGAERNKWGGA